MRMCVCVTMCDHPFLYYIYQVLSSRGDVPKKAVLLAKRSAKSPPPLPGLNGVFSQKSTTF